MESVGRSARAKTKSNFSISCSTWTRGCLHPSPLPVYRRMLLWHVSLHKRWCCQTGQTCRNNIKDQYRQQHVFIHLKVIPNQETHEDWCLGYSLSNDNTSTTTTQLFQTGNGFELSSSKGSRGDLRTRPGGRTTIQHVYELPGESGGGRGGGSGSQITMTHPHTEPQRWKN